MKLPIFDGDIIKWLEFWKLYSSLIKEQPHLSDDVKQAHLIASMGTPACKQQAEAAFAYTKTYDEAVARLRQHYEQNRVLLTHYVKNALTPARFRNRRKDIDRMADMLERNLTGMQKANGYTASQVFAVVFEGYMEPCLNSEWRKRTEDLSEPPMAEEMVEFLRKQSRAVPDDSVSHPERDSYARPNRPNKPVHKTVMRTQLPPGKCFFCQADHAIYACSQFKQKAVRQRRDWVKTKELCFNCLSPNHRSGDCPSQHRCRECSAKHHTLLHEPRVPSRTEGTEATVNLAASKKTITSHHSIPRTAIMMVRAQGLEQRARAQMDSGATISLITSSLANTLKACRVPNSGTQICGVGGTYNSSHQVEVTLIGNRGEEFASLFHVVNTISPTDSRADIAQIFKLPFLKGLVLADPKYIPSAHIDLLLNMGTSNVCSKDSVRHSADRALRVEHTVFGWTVGGHHLNPNQTVVPSYTCLQTSATGEDPEALLRKFWDMERLPSEVHRLTSEDEQAVRHFHETTVRDPDGCYRVTLPWKQPAPTLGRSRDTARFRAIINEKSLRRSGIWTQFEKAAKEYGELGHAIRVPNSDLDKPCELSYFMPMHGVTKSTSSSTKLRVVFDASAKSTNGISLNDALLTGPSLYLLLTTIITRFRKQPIGLTADITKMFREIGLNEADQDFHRFLLRDQEGDYQEWKMTRLTFGVSSSPYLATQVLLKMA